jgi:signal transduction histidine kinase/CHASE1-domain containing sensor protein/ActR/RegA family two-component response regulator
MKTKAKKKYSAVSLTTTVALLCLIAIIITTWFVREHEKIRWQDAFDVGCSDITAEIQKEFNTRVEKLTALRAFFQSSENVTRDEFKTFVYTSESYASDVYAICWAPLIKNEKVEEFLQLTQKNGYDHFEIKTDNNLKQQSDYCMPIFFMKPTSVHKQLLGLDILTRGPHIYNAITKSYKEGKPIATNLIMIPNVNKVGWIVFAAVNKDHSYSSVDSLSDIRGTLFTIFYSENIIKTALSELDPKGINFSVREYNNTSPNTISDIVYYHKSRLHDIKCKNNLLLTFPTLKAEKDIHICGREYRLSFESVPAFFKAYASFESSAVLLCGIAISLLIIFMVWNHSSRREVVEKLVLERTVELRTSRERLASAAEFLNNILDSVPHPVLVLDRNYKVIKNNRAVEYECSAEILDISCCAIMQCEHGECPKAECLAKRVFDSGKTFEEEIKRKVDDEKRTFKVVAAPFAAKEGVIEQVVMTYIDVTSDRKISERVFQARKLEALGQLAGGIAHDLNNVLQVINGYAEMAQKKIDETNPLKRHIDQIYKSGKKAAQLTKSILAFSRKHPMQMQIVNLNTIIDDFKKMLERVIPKNIEMTFSSCSEQCPIEADPNMIEQILMNLCVNAKDAMMSATNGKLTIRLEKKIINCESFRKLYDIKSGEYAVISVSDTGTGIEEAVLDKMFEPFFTTKAVGKGTGLGLSTVFGIVKQHNGLIIPESKIGSGTTFYVYLPITNETPTEIDIAAVSEYENKKGAVVLLVEDEENIREMNASLLEDAGYSVVKASDGKEALKIFKAKESSFDILILDIIMPEMTGTELYKQITKLHKDIPVLFVSGYAADSTQIEFLIQQGVGFLQKPFGSKEFLDKVNHILNKTKDDNKDE